MAYIADTNVYIRAANDSLFRTQLEEFIRDQGLLLVSTVVVAEILIGIADRDKHATAVRALTAGSVPVSPTAADWIRAGGAVAQLGGHAVTKSRSFWNDTLLAAQCGRLGMTLLTHNTSDFRRLQRVLPVRTVHPFP